MAIIDKNGNLGISSQPVKERMLNIDIHEFGTEFIQNFIGVIVATILVGSSAEYFNEKSIFKRSTRKQNGHYWTQRVREIIKTFLHSMPTFLISAIYSALWNLHYAQLYCGHSAFHFGWFQIQMMIYFILFDSVLYWQHRLFHIRAPIDLYEHIHSYHHQFDPITSFASQAMHPIEACIVVSHHFSVAVMMSWIFPLDLLSHQMLGGIGLLWGFFSHDGTFSQFHKTHHETKNSNFALGLFTTFWDRICNTYTDSSEMKANMLQSKRIKIQ